MYIKSPKIIKNRKIKIDIKVKTDTNRNIDRIMYNFDSEISKILGSLSNLFKFKQLFLIIFKLYMRNIY